MTITKILNSYTNGNVKITLYDNGTRIQEWDDSQSPNYELPISMDIKITNYCDRNPLCSYCHEMSSLNGKHGDLDYLFNIIKDLNPGTEIALGGGDPLTHPDLIEFLQKCQEIKLIPNITVNSFILNNQDKIHLLNYLIINKLVYGVGVSISDDFDFGLIKKLDNLNNVVYHVIAGVENVSILDKIKESPVKKVLILGYKEFGKGIKFYSEDVFKSLDNWYLNIDKYIKKMHLSFDNLGITQLNIKSHLSEQEWDSFYQGDDGLSTMYIDAVKQEIAKSSVSSLRYPLKGRMKDLFETIKLNCE